MFTNLPIGPYKLEASKEGFSSFLQSGIVLQVDSNPTIDVVLRVGSVTEQVAPRNLRLLTSFVRRSAIRIWRRTTESGNAP